MKVKVAYKFILLCALTIGLFGIVISGVALYLGWQPWLLSVHLGFAMLLVTSLVLHIYSRKNKALKITSQFRDLVLKSRYPSFCNLDRLITTCGNVTPHALAQQLGLSFQSLEHALHAANITLCAPDRPLRDNFPTNDEKIFSVVSIALYLCFSVNPKEKSYENNSPVRGH
ncbi:hypothetical protein HPC38_05940 [Pasteurellaceae bacterium HPA106]|uniref:hypothetical protein n=1 Tax=Spirabiliibacterium pneumoniae TaxID=221400 RepID=UPI001AADD991|nr:hypothetical protein [Spirabiliibacterium pneumoniae]MBE2896414.1 hypothetical protein [Spirabiliibacterium pneumoniae]